MIPLLLALPVPSPPQAATSPEAAEVLVLAGARVLAPDGRSWLEDRVVVVDGGRIAALRPRAELAPEPGTAVVDLGGLWLVPGLIDLHSHLLLHPYDETPWEDQVLRESLELRTVRAVAAAARTLESGFTSLRELGTEGAGFADVGLRDAIAAGLVPGPRIFAATRAIVAAGGYGPFGFDPRIDLPKGGQVASGIEECRRAVREQVAAGADWIKVYADYRRRADAPATPTFGPDELAAIVAEARRAGVPVAAHASTDAGVRLAVEAGVDTIEHGTEASRATLELLRDAGVVLCPTLAAHEAIARYGGWRPGDPETPRQAQARATFALALELGVRIACGSDVGVFPHGTSARELELLADHGLPLPDVMAAATRTAADVLGRPDLGRVEPGATADLVALAADPLADPGAYREVRWVLKEGAVAADRRALPGADARAAVLAVCRGMLAAHARGDADAVRAAHAPAAVITLVAGEGATAALTLEDFLRVHPPRPGGTAPWFTAEPRVEVEGDLASVRAPYAHAEEQGTALGVARFELVRTDGAWRIVATTLTRRSP